MVSVARPRDPAGVDLLDAREHPQQGGLAAAVAADDTDAVATADAERDGVEHLGGAEREGGALDGDEVGHLVDRWSRSRWAPWTGPARPPDVAHDARWR